MPGISTHSMGCNGLVRGPSRTTWRPLWLQSLDSPVTSKAATALSTPPVIVSPPPDPFAHLRGPRRTWWGTLAWSDPEAPALELFGPPPEVSDPQ